jgi:hypothetical protein
MADRDSLLDSEVCKWEKQGTKKNNY